MHANAQADVDAKCDCCWKCCCRCCCWLMLISFLFFFFFPASFPSVCTTIITGNSSTLLMSGGGGGGGVGLGDREPRNEQLKQSATTHRRRCRAVLFHCLSATLQMVVGTQMAICPVKAASSAVQYKKRKKKERESRAILLSAAWAHHIVRCSIETEWAHL